MKNGKSQTKKNGMSSVKHAVMFKRSHGQNQSIAIKEFTNASSAVKRSAMKRAYLANGCRPD